MPGNSPPWETLQSLDWVQAMAACPQDPEYHREGNVWVHTQMVLDALLRMPMWRALPEEAQRAVYLGCLLHDVGKPSTTKVESGRITSRGHSRRGEHIARRLLYEQGIPFTLREQVCALVRYHQLPFYLIDREDAQRLAIEISMVGRCDLLALVAEADIRGRVCNDLQSILDKIELFTEFCRENSCLNTPYSFPSKHTKYTYFRDTRRQPAVEVYDDTRLEAIVLAGLPGVGKSTLVHRRYPELPEISLDAIRKEIGVRSGENQGPVVQRAKEKAKEYLRRGEPFVWNATNLRQQFRENLLSLLADYKARIRIVYVETPLPKLLEQNRSREAVVPERIIYRMIEQLDLPSAIEAHSLEVILRD